MKILDPPGWPRPSGYANGIAASGAFVFVAGVVGRDPKQRFVSGFVPQFRQILLNTLTILEAGGARADTVVRMTWFVRDLSDYRANLAELGSVYREVFGRHFPAMTVVGVADLVDPEALLEIETTAVIA